LTSTWANVSAAQRAPAITPSCRATKAPRVRAPSGIRPAVKSPRGPMSSASARATASRTAAGDGCTMLLIACLSEDRAPDRHDRAERCASRARTVDHETVAEALRRVREVAAGVGAAALLPSAGGAD